MLKFLHNSKEEGFTLIELMIVIAIIGILAAIAVPQFIPYRKKGYVAYLNSDVKNAYTLSLAYLSEHPNRNVTLEALESAGYKPSPGIVTEVTWTDSSNYSIKAIGQSSWSLSKNDAEMSVVSGVATFSPARQ